MSWYKTPDDLFADKKTAKLNHIKSEVDALFSEGICSLSLGWDIDCRRSATKNDISNMEGLVKLSTNDADIVQIKGADAGVYEISVADLRDIIIPEMYAYGISVYQRKWAAESLVAQATTEEELDNIII